MKELQKVCEKYGLSRLSLTNIIKFWIRGYRRKEISDELGLSRLTVAKYIKRLRKMSYKEIKIIYYSVLR